MAPFTLSHIDQRYAKKQKKKQAGYLKTTLPISNKLVPLSVPLVEAMQS